MRKTIELTVLDNVEIASPCTASWNEMTGNDQVRHCSQCSLNVYNLSAMTREQATDLIAGAEGRVCIRLYRRTDGTVLTQDCPTGLRAARERVVRSVRNIAATVVTLIAGMVGLGARQAWAQDESPRHMMGGLRPVHMEPENSAPKQDTVQTRQDTAQVTKDTVATEEPNEENMIMGLMVVRPVEAEEARFLQESDADTLEEPATVTEEPVEPQPSFEMGEMMVIEKPTLENEPVVPVGVNPDAEPACDPDAPAVDGVEVPRIR